jgi:1,2-phenylacetyl-CoA epoxidase catalytic subunit
VIQGPRVALPERRLVVETLRSLGARELFAAQLLGAGLKLAPSIDDSLVLGQESLRHLERFETLSAMFEGIGAGELLLAAGKVLDGCPAPRSWSELVLARFLLSGAGCAQLERCKRWSAETQFLKAVEEMHVLECEHQEIARATLRDLARQGGVRPVTAQSDLERWTRTVLVFLDGPAARASSRTTQPDASWQGGDLVRDFATAVESTLAVCGLRLPIAGELARDASVGAAAR